MPFDNLFANAEYAALFIFVSAWSACVVCVRLVLRVTSNISATPKTLDGALVVELVPSPDDLKK